MLKYDVCKIRLNCGKPKTQIKHHFRPWEKSCYMYPIYQNKSCHHFLQQFRRIRIYLSKQNYENLENRAVLFV